MTALIEGLLNPAAYPHPAPDIRLIETHISWIVLAGCYAYKLKKPVDLGFLDFSTLEKRHFCCEEELRLNGRLAPDIYLEVVPITGTEQAPHIGGDGAVLEWAVRMRAFPADATLDRAQTMAPEQIDAIADAIARFHQAIPALPAESEYGRSETVRAPVAANFAHIRSLRPPATALPLLDRLQAWSRAEGDALDAHFTQRKVHGFVRECHGDLHLGNIAWVNDAPLIFDGIEFNAGLRCIDVMSEVAFLGMDLVHRGRDDLAWRFLNRYLENTGDTPGLAALTYYQVYRAMVRAKVAAIRASQSNHDFSECLGYLALAQRLAQTRRPSLLLMHGVSGSGKTWLSQHLLERLGAIRLRSDVERKRLFGLAPGDDSGAIPGGIYTREAGARTMARLQEQTGSLLAAGFTVILDATFIAREWRAPFQTLAEAMAVPWRIVSLETPAELLRSRVSQRRAAGRDASEADLDVLTAQLGSMEPLTEAEQPHTLRLTGNWTVDEAVTRLQGSHP